MVTLVLPAMLRGLAGGVASLEVEGATLGAVRTSSAPAIPRWNDRCGTNVDRCGAT
jgi:hypothetical protein